MNEHVENVKETVSENKENKHENNKANRDANYKDKRKNNDRNDRNNRRRNNRNNNNRQPKLYEEKVMDIRRVTKVVKGGRIFSFAATVVVGDRKGKVGLGTGKAKEMPDAVKKATLAATKNVVKIDLIDNRTIAHEITVKEGAARVILKPAAEGTGVKAGGPVRDVLELAGVKDVLSKSLGSSTKINMARATLNALKAQKSPEHVAKLRGKTVEEILG